tara:strand:- start:7846 stop:8787 length:942 start_codon:yes stop_codon:yes gene_type:complete
VIKSQRIIFAGTPKFSIPALESLINSEHEVVAVYTQPDRLSGRGRKAKPSDVKKFALDNGLIVQTPINLKNKKDIEIFNSFNPDLLVVAAYGVILTNDILHAPTLGCINIHASILPKWRGAAPIQRSLLAGEAFTGISIMHMEASLDSGPVYKTQEIPINPSDTSDSLSEKLSIIGARTLMDSLPGIIDGSMPCIPQKSDIATYASKLTKADSWINWSDSAIKIDQKVRALQPWPIAQTYFQEKIVRIWKSEPIMGTGEKIGNLMISSNKDLDVVTGEGLIRVLKLQMPGKNIITAQDFLNSFDLTDSFFGDR